MPPDYLVAASADAYNSHSYKRKETDMQPERRHCTRPVCCAVDNKNQPVWTLLVSVWGPSLLKADEY